jgi:hypothetical protein
MATFNKMQQFVADLGTKLINLNTDALTILLTNTVPNVADTLVDTTTSTCTVKATSNALEIAAGNGYTKKGAAIGSVAYSQTSGTGKLTGNAVTFSASGGTIGPFQYAVLYDDTSGTTSTRSALGWWNYSSAVTLADGESFKVAADTAGANWSSGTPLLTVA